MEAPVDAYMLVVKVCMWPGGDPSRERVLSLATLACLGQARRDEPSLGVVEGERAYSVKLYKDTAFGGPAENPRGGAIWREGLVRGHRPGPRGAWDLLGGALAILLGSRLRGYVAGGLVEGETPPMQADPPPPVKTP